MQSCYSKIDGMKENPPFSTATVHKICSNKKWHLSTQSASTFCGRLRSKLRALETNTAGARNCCRKGSEMMRMLSIRADVGQSKTKKREQAPQKSSFPMYILDKCLYNSESYLPTTKSST